MAGPSPKLENRRIAFVLGGGGNLGSYEVGMLHALLERDIVPDIVVGTSVGALNGAAIAAEPTMATVESLREAWLTLGRRRVFASPFGGAGALFSKGTHLHSNDELRALIKRLLPVETFEELKVPFHCVAASIERAAEQWFSEGPITDAILASSAVPGLLPPVQIGSEHYLDGGLVNSIPVDRAVQLGATDLYVLHVGRIERPLEPPRNLLQVAMVAFEIARRHRFAREMAALPAGVVSHVLPTGEEDLPAYDPIGQLRYRDFRRVGERMERAYGATSRYLESLSQLSTKG